MDPNDRPEVNFLPEGTQGAIVSLGNEVYALKNEIKDIKEVINKYSESSDKHANAIKWLTFGLFAVAVLQVVAALILKN